MDRPPFSLCGEICPEAFHSEEAATTTDTTRVKLKQTGLASPCNVMERREFDR